MALPTALCIERICYYTPTCCGCLMPGVQDKAGRIIESMGLASSDRQKSSFAFSTKPAPSTWNAFFFETNSEIPIYYIITNEDSLSKLRTFVSGIKKTAYVIVATLNNYSVVFIRRFDSNTTKKYHAFTLNKNSDYNKLINTLRKYNIIEDSLTGSTNLNAIVKDLFHSSDSYTNRGLFSTHYLDTHLFKKLKKRKRSIDKESKKIFSVLQNESLEDGFDDYVQLILQELGYHDLKQDNAKLHLHFKPHESALAILTKHDEFDIRHDDSVPSMGAVASLAEYEWVILTNGKLWRMYSSKISSASTNYFEINLDGVTDYQDLQLQYFVAIFSAHSRINDASGKSDLDVVH